MTTDFQAILAQTLQDHRLSGSEKRALKEVIAESVLDANQRALCRHQAFELAKSELTDPKVSEVIDWLEDVVKLLLPPEAKEPVAESYFHPGEDCTNRVLSLLRNARRSADLCVFTITDNNVSRAILETHGRGVKVRIITDDDKVHDLGSDIEELDRKGIPVRVDKTIAHMHHKFALFDDAYLANGSYNWTRGAKENMENLLVTNEPKFLAAYRKEFDRLWEELS